MLDDYGDCDFRLFERGERHEQGVVPVLVRDRSLRIRSFTTCDVPVFPATFTSDSRAAAAGPVRLVDDRQSPSLTSEGLPA